MNASTSGGSAISVAAAISAPQFEKRVAVRLGLGRETDHDLRLPTRIGQFAQDVGVLDQTQLERVALRLLLDLLLGDGLRAVIGNRRGHDHHVCRARGEKSRLLQFQRRRHVNDVCTEQPVRFEHAVVDVRHDSIVNP